MKHLLIIASLVLSNTIVFSQIKVDNIGDVTIGESIKTLKHSSGNIITTQLYSPRWDGGFIIDKSGYYDASTFRPNTNWYGMLGTSTHKWGVAYIEHIYTWIFTNYSDETLKENIRALDSPLQKIQQLHGVSYDVKDSYYKLEDLDLHEKYFQPGIDIENEKQKDKEYKEQLRLKSKNQIGFLAQDLQKVFPELVYKENDSSEYSINYIGLIPVLVESIKEQQQIIENQSKDISELKAKVESSSTKKSSTINSTIDDEKSISTLYQNSPNPFTSQTEIKFEIAENSSSAYLNIYNLEGLQLMSKKLSDKGLSSIIIEGSELKAGMYLYSLIVDGEEIDTKRMILTN